VGQRAGRIVTAPLWERCNGRWRSSILPALGIDPRFLTGKNCPCPICGGRDRFRFDNKRGDGTWICTHCRAGQGVRLAMLYLGITDFRAIAEKIEAVIGGAARERARPDLSEEVKRAALTRLWRTSAPVRAGDPVDLWMRRRGLGASTYPSCLRSHPSLRHSGPPVTVHPGMLAKVVDAGGRPVMLHRTFLTADGRKAPVDKVRMFCAGTVPPGSAVRLSPPASTMGIAEGIETALAAARLFAMPVWAALCDRGVETFEPPPGTERLLAFGDNDGNGAGQRAAYALAARLSTKMKVDVSIPDQPDTDWNDVLLERETAA
jgi:putative DNA primase/helicase